MATPEEKLVELEARVGHPGEKWQALTDRVQDEAVKQFAEVQSNWLDLLWTLDAYRIAGVPPRDMPGPLDPLARLAAIYRGKGNWFAGLLALLLENRTSLRIAPRTSVQGFSQTHQVDLAWPARKLDPLICAETKVTGAPAYGSYPARGAMSDWSNRRKELKFAATDLKLYRRQQDTKIEHWGVWREQQPPKTYFLWAARLRPGETVQKMIEEAQAVVNTYLDGAGIFAWVENDDASGYEPVPLPQSSHITALDDVLYRIASEINALAGPEREPPAPVTPDKPAVQAEKLIPDEGDA